MRLCLSHPSKLHWLFYLSGSFPVRQNQLREILSIHFLLNSIIYHKRFYDYTYFGNLRAGTPLQYSNQSLWNKVARLYHVPKHLKKHNKFPKYKINLTHRVIFCKALLYSVANMYQYSEKPTASIVRVSSSMALCVCGYRPHLLHNVTSLF